MNKKILLAAIIICVAVFFILTIPANIESEVYTKQGTLANIWISESGMITLTFDDGEDVIVTEDTTEEAQEMYQYLVGWLNQEIIITYSFDYYMMANHINSVSPAN